MPEEVQVVETCTSFIHKESFHFDSLLPASFEEDKGIIKLLIAVFDAPFLLTRKLQLNCARMDTNAFKVF